MSYSAEQIESMEVAREMAHRDLIRLVGRLIDAGSSSADMRVREHFHNGAARRLKTLDRAMRNVFSLFPLLAKSPIPREERDDAQINLHAFLINLYGYFDNLAWAFVVRHRLEECLRNPRRVGMFHAATQARLPAELSDYLRSDVIAGWQREYLVSYRDALAHRIPPYIPPAWFSESDKVQHVQLESEIADMARIGRWERVAELTDTQASLGTPCFAFVHALGEEGPARPVGLHPQMIADANTAVAIGDRFLNCWAVCTPA